MDDDAPAGAGAPGPVLRAGPAGAWIPLLRNRGFRNLAISTLTSTLGDWIGFLAIIALTADILGPTRAAAFAVSAVMAVRVLPSLVLGPIAGVFVDRWNRRRVMIVTHLGRGVVMALIPFTNEILALLLATLVIEVMSALFAPAKDAMIPLLVEREQLVHANQINLVTTYGTLPLGGALYAVLVAYAAAAFPEGSFLAQRPVAAAIWFNAVSFFVAAPLVARIPAVKGTPGRGATRSGIDPVTAPSAWEELKEGLRFIGGQPVIRSLVVGVMVAFAAAGVVITSGEFFASLLNAGQSGYGILVAVVGSGLVIGLFAAAPLTRRLGPERLFAPGIGLAGLALMVTAVMPTMGFASIPAVVMGFGAGVAFIVGYTVLQQRADDRIRGRTFGAFNSGVRAAIFGSTIVVPTMIGLLGRERREFTVLDDGTTVLIYPYTFGGVRITLLAGGLFAMMGAVAAGTALHRALARERSERLVLPTLAPPIAPPRPGCLVVFEGGDGSGKSTQIRMLERALTEAGHHVVVTREPGGTPVGEGIRTLLLDSPPGSIGDRTEALLYAGARAQHVDRVIRPALETGAVVLCDRFVDSSVVYQGAARELGEDHVVELNRWATGGLEPDLTVLLDIDPADGLRRATDGRDADRMESEGDGFHHAVRDAYLRRSTSGPGDYLVLDATRTVDDLHREIVDVVLEHLGPADDPA